MLKTAAIMGCLTVLLFPATAPADEIDYPALGIKLTDVPASGKSLAVGEMWKGYHVQIQFGKTASVEISRFDETVPQGNIAKKGYREALLNQLGIHQLSGGIQKLVSVAGYPAWMVGSGQRLGPMVVLQSTCFLVVSQHLYEIAISAAGPSRPATSSFHAAAEMVGSGLIFEPAQTPAEKPLAPAEMPRFLMSSESHAYYPDSARKLGEQGAVELKFNIDGAGTAQDVLVAGDANADLAKAAQSMLTSGGFKVPQGWEQSGGSKQTFVMEFRFELTCPAAHPPREVVPDAQVVTICGSDLNR